MAELGNWFLQYDNAPSRDTTIDKQFVARKTLPFFTTPTYSPDLAPADYFRFPKVKFTLKGRHFSTISEIQNNVTSELKSIAATEFYRDIRSFTAMPIGV